MATVDWNVRIILIHIKVLMQYAFKGKSTSFKKYKFEALDKLTLKGLKITLEKDNQFFAQ